MLALYMLNDGMSKVFGAPVSYNPPSDIRVLGLHMPFTTLFQNEMCIRVYICISGCSCKQYMFNDGISKVFCALVS